MVLQSKVINHGTICRLELDEMESVGEGKLRILHHVDRAKVKDYDQEVMKNFLAFNQYGRTKGSGSS